MPNGSVKPQSYSFLCSVPVEGLAGVNRINLLTYSLFITDAAADQNDKRFVGVYIYIWIDIKVEKSSGNLVFRSCRTLLNDFSN